MNPLLNNQQHRWKQLKQYVVNGFDDVDLSSLKSWADSKELNKTKRTILSFWYSICDNVPTAVFLYNNIDLRNATEESLEMFWENYKDKLIFQRDRRWVRIANQFVGICLDFKDKWYPIGETMKPLVQADNSFEAILKAFSKLRYQGRVSSYSFLDALTATGVIPTQQPEKFDWNNGQTCTEGMLQALCKDDEAYRFKKGKNRLDKATCEMLDEALCRLKKELREEYPDLPQDNIDDYESSLCVFRKYMKGMMYYGYYIDRQLGELKKLEKTLGAETKGICDELYTIRRQVYKDSMLGELHGWDGVRNHLMGNFLKTGVIDFDS
jgi:hypothetical protein